MTFVERHNIAEHIYKQLKQTLTQLAEDDRVAVVENLAKSLKFLTYSDVQ